MTLTSNLTTKHWILALVTVILFFYPFALSSMASSPTGFFLALPSWFWVVIGITVVMYILVYFFVTTPAKSEPEEVM